MACLLIADELWRDFAEWRTSVISYGEEAGFTIWVNAISEYYSQWGKLPDLTTLQSLATNGMSRLSPEELLVVNRDCRQAAMMVSAWVGTVDLTEIVKVGRVMLTDYLRERMISTSAAGMQYKPSEATGLLDGLQRNLAAIDGMSGTRFKPFYPDNDFPILPPESYQQVGVDLVDTMCSGGLVAGEVVGHAAPIGSGKTTLVLQVTYARALQLYMREIENARLAGRTIDLSQVPRVYVFVYEQVATLRAYHASNSASIPRKTAEAATFYGTKVAKFSTREDRQYKDYEHKLYGNQIAEAAAGRCEWPWGELERFQLAARLTNALIEVVDFSGHDKELRKWAEAGEAGMLSYIRAHQAATREPGVNFVALDYVGAMVDTGCRAGRLRINDKTDHIKMAPNNLSREIASEFRCPIWAAQQLSPDENAKAGGTIPNPMAASGSRMFLEYCSVGIASGKLTKDNVGVYVLGKQRRSQTAGSATYLAKLDETYARWTLAKDFVMSEGMIMPRNEVGQLQAPPGRHRLSSGGFGDRHVE